MTHARTFFAAAHVVMRSTYAHVDHAPERPGAPEEIAAHVDWEATTAVRRHLIAHGLGVAEAMDTAQRSELDWSVAQELIRRTAALGAPFVAGAGADHLPVPVNVDRDGLADAVAWQANEILRLGGVPIVLSLPALSRARLDEDGYVDFYRRVIERVDGELLVHWLGEAFLPALAGYFPGDSFDRVMAIDPAKVRGCKLSLLDPALERRVRERLLPRGQVVWTGDDFHFADLIVGEDPAVRGFGSLGGRPLALGRFSHALLGAFDGAARPAAQALERLDAGDVVGARERLESIERLARVVFEPPTRHYKAGLAFLAWLDGLQPNALLPNHLERSRDAAHYRRVAAAARDAGALADAAGAAARLASWEEAQGLPPTS